MGSGKSAAKRSARIAQENLDRQRQIDSEKALEEDDEIARRLAAGNNKRFGRQSLIKTSETGTARKTLG